MVQVWIREVNQNFGKAIRGERLGESHTRWTVLVNKIIHFMKLIS
jgi:hypothetical protein